MRRDPSPNSWKSLWCTHSPFSCLENKRIVIHQLLYWPAEALEFQTRETFGVRFCRRVSNAALANAALVLSSKNRKEYSRWGAASKNKSKKS